MQPKMPCLSWTISTTTAEMTTYYSTFWLYITRSSWSYNLYLFSFYIGCSPMCFKAVQPNKSWSFCDQLWLFATKCSHRVHSRTTMNSRDWSRPCKSYKLKFGKTQSLNGLSAGMRFKSTAVKTKKQLDKKMFPDESNCQFKTTNVILSSIYSNVCRSLNILVKYVFFKDQK